MPRARKHLVSIADTPYYHVTARCVRRAFLCGTDKESGRNYEHRRCWIEDRIRVLASIFSIEICAYAVMSNHYHLVVKLADGMTDRWSDNEVLNRWTSLHRGPLLVQKYLSNEGLNDAELATVRSMAAVYRVRLASLSWFMKCLNEPIARKANAEDGCTGHFWEARFHSQALRSEKALFGAMAYVDLNPVRARAASTPEESEFTSIAARVRKKEACDRLTIAASRMTEAGDLYHFGISIRPLLPFADTALDPGTDALPIYEREYLLLLDHSARRIVHGKRGYLDENVTPILERLGLAEDQWIHASTQFRRHYRNGDLRPVNAA